MNRERDAYDWGPPHSMNREEQEDYRIQRLRDKAYNEWASEDSFQRLLWDYANIDSALVLA